MRIYYASNRAVDLVRSLRCHDVDRRLPRVQEAVDGLIRQISDLAAPGSRMCFDALHRDHMDGRVHCRGYSCGSQASPDCGHLHRCLHIHMCMAQQAAGSEGWWRGAVLNLLRCLKHCHPQPGCVIGMEDPGKHVQAMYQDWHCKRAREAKACNPGYMWPRKSLCSLTLEKCTTLWQPRLIGAHMGMWQ